MSPGQPPQQWQHACSKQDFPFYAALQLLRIIVNANNLTNEQVYT